MKNLFLILVAIFSFALTACDKKTFSPVDPTNGTQSDPTCDSTIPQIIHPTSVVSGENFTLAFNRTDVTWTLTPQGASAITLAGSPITTSITPVGTVTGSVSGTDNCGLHSYQEFSFEVTAAPPTTTLPPPTTTLPPPTTTLPPPTTTLPPPTTTLPPPTTTLPPPTTTLPPPQPVIQDFTASGAAADILFVVNDSPTMWSVLSESTPTRFAKFVKNLGGVDYHIAVTSAQTTGPLDYQSGRVTRILYSPVPNSGLALIPLQYVITPSLSQASQDFLATIMRPEVICTQVAGACPNEGKAYQEAIHSSILTLNNANSVAKFIRPNAALNIVIISDDDEGAGNLTDSHGNIKPTAPAYNLPQTLINLVQSKWPGKQFRVHAVIQRPTDSWCADPDIYNARNAYLYSQLVTKTGGVSAAICDVDDTKQIKNIAQSIATGPTSYQLNCAPTSLTATYSPQPAQTPKVVISGSSLSFAPALPAGTKVHVQYFCQ